MAEEHQFIDETEAIENALDGGDFDDIHSLKGILSEALGNKLFKVALVVVIIFNFLYTFYNAFKEKRHDERFISRTDCICEPNDKRFYTIITMGTILVWVLLVIIYCGTKIFRKCSKNDDRITNERFAAASKGLRRHKRFFKRELIRLVASRYYLDHDELEIIKPQPPKYYPKDIQNIYPTKEFSQNRQQGKTKSYTNSRKWGCTMCCKFLLITVRFMIQISLVPLVIFQWLDQYAWSCIMDGDENDCEKLSGRYRNEINQSFMIYSIYVAILLAVLFTIMIKWLPKGFPNFHTTFGVYMQQIYEQLIAEDQANDHENENET